MKPSVAIFILLAIKIARRFYAMNNKKDGKSKGKCKTVEIKASYDVEGGTNPHWAHICFDTCVFHQGSHHDELIIAEKLLNNNELDIMTTSSIMQKEILTFKTPNAVKRKASAIVTDGDDELTTQELELKEKIKDIIIGNAKPENMENDAENIFHAQKYCQYFVTTDAQLIKKRGQLKQLLPCLIILLPSELEELIRSQDEQYHPEVKHREKIRRLLKLIDKVVTKSKVRDLGFWAQPADRNLVIKNICHALDCLREEKIELCEDSINLAEDLGSGRPCSFSSDDLELAKKITFQQLTEIVNNLIRGCNSEKFDIAIKSIPVFYSTVAKA